MLEEGTRAEQTLHLQLETTELDTAETLAKSAIPKTVLSNILSLPGSSCIYKRSSSDLRTSKEIMNMSFSQNQQQA